MENKNTELSRAVFDLYLFLHQRAGSFMSALFDCFMKADPNNFQKLGQSFPSQALAVSMWRHCENEAEFFRSYGVIF